MNSWSLNAALNRESIGTLTSFFFGRENRGSVCIIENRGSVVIRLVLSMSFCRFGMLSPHRQKFHHGWKISISTIEQSLQQVNKIILQISPFFENVFVLVTAAIMENKDAQATVDKSTMGLLIVEGGFEDQVCPLTRELFLLQFCSLEANS
jgi:hypothetical protein